MTPEERMKRMNEMNEFRDKMRKFLDGEISERPMPPGYVHPHGRSTLGEERSHNQPTGGSVFFSFSLDD